MNIRTANHKARRALRRAVYAAGLAFHEQRVMRLARNGQLDRLKRSGFIKRKII